MKKVFLLTFWLSDDVQSYRQFVFDDCSLSFLYFEKACHLNFKSVNLRILAYEPIWQPDSIEWIKQEFEIFGYLENQTSTPSI